MPINTKGAKRGWIYDPSDKSLGIYVDGEKVGSIQGGQSTTYEAIAYCVDGYGFGLDKTYVSGSAQRLFGLEVNTDTGGTDLTGNVMDGSIRGKLTIGTTQTNASLYAIVGEVNVGTCNLTSGNFGAVYATMDLYGDNTMAGAPPHTAALFATLWNEGTTTLNSAGGSLSGIEIIQNGSATITSGVNPAIYIRGNAKWQYAIYATYCNRFAYATSALTGSSALDVMKFEVTDTQTLSTGYTHGIYINWTKTGAQTGGAVNPFSIDFAATTAACTDVALESHYLTQTGNKLTGNVSILQAYVEDVGTGVGNVMLVDIGAVAGTGHSASRYAFMRCKQHSASYSYDEVFYIEGTSNKMATNLFTFCGCEGAPVQAGTTLSGGITGRIKVLVENTPGAGTTTLYIPLYAS